jgi:hypothetical protein
MCKGCFWFWFVFAGQNEICEIKHSNWDCREQKETQKSKTTGRF